MYLSDFWIELVYSDEAAGYMVCVACRIARLGDYCLKNVKVHSRTTSPKTRRHISEHLERQKHC